MTDEHAKNLDAALAHALLDRLRATPDVAAAREDLERLRHFGSRGQIQFLREALKYLVEITPSDSVDHQKFDAELISLPPEEKRPDNAPDVKLLVMIPDPLPATGPLPAEPLGGEGWPVPPMFAADWSEIKEDALTAATQRSLACFASALDPKEILAVRAGRAAELPSYPGYTAVELLFRGSEDEELTHIGVFGDGKALLVNGVSPGIHELNAGGPTIDDKLGLSPLALKSEEQVQAYLRFFCGCVHGEEGPFSIIETAEQLEVRWVESAVPDAILENVAPITATVREAEQEGDNLATEEEQLADSEANDSSGEPTNATNKLTPPQSAADTNLTWTATATVLYSGALFTAKFRIQPTGLIEMEEDEPVAADLPILRDGFLHHLRIGTTKRAKLS
jgi:hypothetical protein